MQINWKLRLQNKTVLLALIGALVTFAYTLLGILEIAAPIGESEVLQAASVLVHILVLLGIVVDPTTKGVEDSAKAMAYNQPR